MSKFFQNIQTSDPIPELLAKTIRSIRFDPESKPNKLLVQSTSHLLHEQIQEINALSHDHKDTFHIIIISATISPDILHLLPPVLL